MNINDHVYVKLTIEGRKAHDDYFVNFSAKYGTPLELIYREPKAVGAWFEYQLHELMMIFGPSIHMTCPTLFEDNEIAFKLPANVPQTTS